MTIVCPGDSVGAGSPRGCPLPMVLRYVTKLSSLRHTRKSPARRIVAAFVGGIHTLTCRNTPPVCGMDSELLPDTPRRITSELLLPMVNRSQETCAGRQHARRRLRTGDFQLARGAEHRRRTSCSRKPSECLVAASTNCLRKFHPLRFEFEFQALRTNLRHSIAFIDLSCTVASYSWFA